MATEKSNSNGPVTGLDDQPVNQTDEKGHVAVDSASESGLGSEDERNTGGLAGVEKVEATTKAWTKTWLIVTYIL